MKQLNRQFLAPRCVYWSDGTHYVMLAIAEVLQWPFVKSVAREVHLRSLLRCT
jgi:hypothetical protein